MNQILKKMFIPIICMTFLVCCQTDNDIQIDEIEKTFTISKEDIFEYDLGIFGDEEGARIKKQPSKFEISEIYYDENDSFRAIYRYKPKVNFSGTEYVELISSYGSDGASPNDYHILTKLTIQVE